MDFKKITFSLAVLSLLFSSFALAGGITYEYDSRNQLKNATYSDGTVIAYAYDNIGNRVSMAVTVPDVDGDEMSDTWETIYFGNLDRDGSGDFDGDGITDLDEYRTGTNPGLDETAAAGEPASAANTAGDARVKELPADATGTAPLTAAAGVSNPINAGDGKGAAANIRHCCDSRLDGTWSTDSKIRVAVQGTTGEALEGLNVHAFTEQGHDPELLSITDGEGIAVFDPGDFADGEYIFRVDYLSGQFWSDLIDVPDIRVAEVLIDEELVEVTVSDEENAGINVYLHDANGTYLDRYAETDGVGRAAFDLPTGESFRFRAELQGIQYWSDIVTIKSGEVNQVEISTGGSEFAVTFLGPYRGEAAQ